MDGEPRRKACRLPRRRSWRDLLSWRLSRSGGAKPCRSSAQCWASRNASVTGRRNPGWASMLVAGAKSVVNGAWDSPIVFLLSGFAALDVGDCGEEHSAAEPLHLAERHLHGVPVGDRCV